MTYSDGMPVLEARLPTGRYDMIIETGVLERAGELVRQVAPHEQALLVVDSAVVNTAGVVVGAALESAGYRAVTVPLDASERFKTIDTVERVYGVMLEARLERGSPVIALGGGLVGDVAGFVAATYLRGVPVIQVPTTLLAMVDASIGGKTGVNHALPHGGLGKNLIGAFWQPRRIIADPVTLRTLSERDLRCGLAECVKHGVIADPSLLQFIAGSAEAIAARDEAVLAELIARSAQIKITIIEQDEREDANRALLNLGHTFAHAIEPIETLDLRHGEAVAIGLCAAMHCAVSTGSMSSGDAETVTSLLQRLGLPTRLPSSVAAAPLVARMRYDKKVRDGQLRLVLPCGIGTAKIVETDEPVIVDALHGIGAAP
jgi:3-dehydroquinate synthase